MGFLKKLLGREDDPIDAFGQASGASIEPAPPGSSPPPGDASAPPPADVSTPFVSFSSTPMEASWSSVVVNGRELPPDEAKAFTQAFEGLGNLASEGSSQVVDLSDVPGVRDQVLGAMRDHSGNPAALQTALLQAMQRMQAMSGASAPAQSGGDPVERLKKLDELRDQGVLTDAEFDAQKKKLLEDL